MAFPLIPLAIIGIGAYLATNMGGKKESSTKTPLTWSEVGDAFKDVPEPLKTTAINGISFATKEQIGELEKLANGLEGLGHKAAAAVVRKRIEQLKTGGVAPPSKDLEA